MNIAIISTKSTIIFIAIMNGKPRILLMASSVPAAMVAIKQSPPFPNMWKMEHGGAVK